MDCGRAMWCKSTHQLKEEQTTDKYKTMNFKNNMLSKKKSDTNEYVHYDSIYMNF